MRNVKEQKIRNVCELRKHIETYILILVHTVSFFLKLFTWIYEAFIRLHLLMIH